MNDCKGYLELIHKPYNKLLAKEIIIAFEGSVTHQVMKAVTSVVEEKLEEDNESEMVQRKVYHIMVECLQNINRHAVPFYDSDNGYPGRGAILVTQKESAYTVKTVNLIKVKHESKLKSFLNLINPLSENELNEMYKSQLITGNMSDKGGAGLGFIDIRRKVGIQFEFEFVEQDDETSFFIFQIQIPR